MNRPSDGRGFEAPARAPFGEADGNRVSIKDNLEEPPPPITRDEAGRVAEQLFGLAVTDSRELPGERDRNFLIATGAGRYVLKVVHPAEDRAISDFQTRLLMHLSAAGLAVPTIVPPVHGQRPFVEPERQPGCECFVRCVTYLPGRRMFGTSPSRRRWRALGRFLARLDLALADFSHPAADHPFLWDIKRADQVSPLAEHIREAERRWRAQRILDSFAGDIRPRLRSLRDQVIHNDGNPHNVLVGRADPDGITGIIDFGDAVQAPLVQEIAVAIAYQPLSELGPFSAAHDITAGYHEVSPLQETEVALIPALVATRLALTTVITSWRAALHPENGGYIMRNDATIDANLARIGELCSGDGPARFAEQILEAPTPLDRFA